MKTTKLLALATALLCSAIVMAQSKTTFGIRGGVNFSNINGKDAEGNNWDNKLKTGFNAGVNVEIPVGIDFYLQPGLLFTTKGAKSEASSDISTTLSYLELPINFIYKPDLGQGRMLLGFGPYFAYGVSGTYKFGDAKSDVEWGDGEFELKPFDAGANLLVGYEFANNLSFQLNAGLGLVNFKNRVGGDNESTYKNTTFGISAGYRF